MTDTTTSSNADSGPAYSSEPDGLRQAAADHRAQQDQPADDLQPQPIPTTAEIEGREDDDEGVSAHRAAKALSRYRQAMAENRAALDEAMGLTETAPAETPPADPAQQTRVAEAEQLQAAVHEAIEAEWQRAHQARTANIHALQVAESVITAEFLRDFPDVKSLNDLHALAHSNPERYVKAHAALSRAQAVVNEHQQLGQQAAQDTQAQYQHWAKQQDDAFTARHPELKDPAIAKQMGDLAKRELAKIARLDAVFANDETPGRARIERGRHWLVPLLVTIRSEDEHRRHFESRDDETGALRAKSRYLRYFREIRVMQDELEELAARGLVRRRPVGWHHPHRLVRRPASPRRAFQGQRADPRPQPAHRFVEDLRVPPEKERRDRPVERRASGRHHGPQARGHRAHPRPPAARPRLALLTASDGGRFPRPAQLRDPAPPRDPPHPATGAGR